jgi:NADP-dependent 3-hydroxy acid dehydrogenase YdfG
MEHMTSQQRRPVAVVAGASRGIGAATAIALGGTHRVHLLGRDARALAEVAGRLPDAAVHAVDVTDTDALTAVVNGLSTVDVLVHSAGVVDIAPLSEITRETWEKTFQVNVIAVAELTRMLLPALRAANATVVLVNSGQGRNASANWGPYAASKFALRAYADVLRAEEPALRVSTVYPGRTATAMQRSVRAAEGGEYEENRYLAPESVARAIMSAVTATADAQLPEIIVRPVT